MTTMKRRSNEEISMQLRTLSTLLHDIILKDYTDRFKRETILHVHIELDKLANEIKD